MGLCIDISNRVGLEIRRQSIAITVDGATVDQSSTYARIEFDTADLDDVIRALVEAQRHGIARKLKGKEPTP